MEEFDVEEGLSIKLRKFIRWQQAWQEAAPMQRLHLWV